MIEIIRVFYFFISITLNLLFAKIYLFFLVSGFLILKDRMACHSNTELLLYSYVPELCESKRPLNNEKEFFAGL